MKSYWSKLLCVGALLMSMGALADEVAFPTQAQLNRSVHIPEKMAADDVAIPSLAHRVTDLTATLSEAEQASLEAKLAQFEQSKGSQIAVLIVPTTQPEAIEQYAIRVVDAWKLGRDKVDDGVMLLVAKNDHKLRIEVGYGLEGAIPDAVAKRIIAETIAPLFKQGDFAGGVNAGVDALIALISGESLPAPQAQGSTQGDMSQWLPMVLIAAVVIGGVLRALFGRFFGGVATGGLIGFLVMLLGGTLVTALLFGALAFVFSLLGLANTVGNMGGYSGGLAVGMGVVVAMFFLAAAVALAAAGLLVIGDSMIEKSMLENP